MRDVVEFIGANDSYFLLGLLVLSLALLFQNASLSGRLARLNRHRERTIEHGSVEDILESLEAQTEAVAGVRQRMDEFAEHQRHQDDVLSRCLQKFGLVRFNAFDDVGGEQSFALALLDEQRNGVVISSLYGRQDSRLYVKSIDGGKGERPLSEEERRALEQAAT